MTQNRRCVTIEIFHLHSNKNPTDILLCSCLLVVSCSVGVMVLFWFYCGLFVCLFKRRIVNCALVNWTLLFPVIDAWI